MKKIKGTILITNDKKGCPNLTKKDLAKIERVIDDDKELIELLKKLAKE